MWKLCHWMISPAASSSMAFICGYFFSAAMVALMMNGRKESFSPPPGRAFS